MAYLHTVADLGHMPMAPDEVPEQAHMLAGTAAVVGAAAADAAVGVENRYGGWGRLEGVAAVVACPCQEEGSWHKQVQHNAGQVGGWGHRMSWGCMGVHKLGCQVLSEEAMSDSSV